MASAIQSYNDIRPGRMFLANVKALMFPQGQNLKEQGQQRIESPSTPPKDKERLFEKFFKNSMLRKKKYQGLSGYPDKVCRVVINQTVRGNRERFHPNV